MTPARADAFVVKVEITRDWCMNMALLAGDSEIGAGLVAEDDPRFVFGRFVRLMRRDRGLTIERLADDAAVDVAELACIEDDTYHRPEVRTVCQLAKFFGVRSPKLMQLAGLAVRNNGRFSEAAARFAGRSAPLVALTTGERAELEAFVAVLSA